jgi:hypothetical protein
LPFAGDPFILQVTGVFTRIHLRAMDVGGLWRREQVDLIVKL